MLKFLKIVFIVVAFWTGVFGQGTGFKFPDTIWMKVTYYDKDYYEHSGAVFQPGYPDDDYNCGLKKGMIQDYLSADRKPIFKANLCDNLNVSNWFRPSTRNALPDTAAKYVVNSAQNSWHWTNLVNYKQRPNEFVSSLYDSTDGMRTIIMYDSLAFTLVTDSVQRAKGIYSYNNGWFFPLDGKGFNDEWGPTGIYPSPTPDGKNHNYVFTMEMHHEFQFQGGEKFIFSGDDDVWVFINGKLAIDLGGSHGEIADSIILDSATALNFGLIKGGRYNFDFFYTENHPAEAHCRITTNIIAPVPPKLILLTTSPNPPVSPFVQPVFPCVKAGECLDLYAWVIDDTNAVRTNLQFSWNIIDTLGNNLGSTQFTGHHNQFCFTKAHGAEMLIMSALDTAYPLNVVRDTIAICVTNANADHVSIEAQPDLSGLSRNNNPLDTMVISANTLKDSIYALLRDPYGNFVSHSLHTSWTILPGSDSVIVLLPGRTIYGEEVVSKIGPPGVARVVATALDSTGLVRNKDTLVVIVANTVYTRLKLYVKNVANQPDTTVRSVTVKVGTDTMFFVQGLRSDGLGWEPVSAAWTLLQGLGAGTTPPSSSSSWRFAPVAPDTGWIKASFAGRSDSIRVYSVSAEPSSLKLYRMAGDPSGQQSIAQPPALMSNWRCGDSLNLYANVFDPNGNWLAAYATSPLPNGAIIEWKVFDASTGQEILPGLGWGVLSSASGYHTTFVPFKARDTFDIVATFIPLIGTSFTSTVRLVTLPGPARNLVIENSLDSTSFGNQRVGTYTMPSTQTIQRFYTKIRDQYGNFIAFADSAVWSSHDTTVAQASSGPQGQFGQGTIVRVQSSGVVQIDARSKNAGFKDSIVIVLTSYTYTNLRIVVRDSSLLFHDSLIMSTNDDTTLYVQGLRSDTTLWETIKVKWETSVGLSIVPLPPSLDNHWTFSPSVPDTTGLNWIRVTTGDDATTKPDSVRVRFIRGRPLRATLELITPDSLRIAGDTIVGIVRLYNRDGLVPGTFCYPGNGGSSAIYFDAISAGFSRPQPIAITSEGYDTLNVPGGSLTNSVPQCFSGGSDTVKFVLYYAPDVVQSPDSVHHLSILLDTIAVSAPSFVLHPGRLQSLQQQIPDVPVGNHHYFRNLVDTILTCPDGALLIYAVGFDAYGNWMGAQACTWEATPTLHAVATLTGPIQYYTTTAVVENEAGFLIATTVDHSHGVFTDSVAITIIGQPTRLQSAWTKDKNGNGFLEQIFLQFNRPVDFPCGASVASKIKIRRYASNTDAGNYTFVIDSIGGCGHKQQTFTVYVHEDTSLFLSSKLSDFQTGWKPAIYFSGLSDRIEDALTPIICADSAAPVVVYVLKTMENPDKRDKDIVTVVLSEPVYGTDRPNPLKLTSPADYFDVWKFDAVTEVWGKTPILNGIMMCETFIDTAGVVFTMSNNQDLNQSHYFSLRHDSSGLSWAYYVTDINGNIPAIPNRRAPVIVMGKPGSVLLAGPNPAGPTTQHSGPQGSIDVRNQPLASQWADPNRGQGGIDFAYKIPLPAESDRLTVAVDMRIFDVVGNLVNQGSTTNALGGTSFASSGSGEVVTIHHYWNGTNARGMKVAPGVYRVVLYCKYTDAGSNLRVTQKLMTTVGISR